MRWVLDIEVPYEGIHNIYCDSAEEVIEMAKRAGYGNTVWIRPHTLVYEPYQFEQLFRSGQLPVE